MIYATRVTLIGLLWTTFCGYTMGQMDSAFVQIARENAVQRYEQAIERQAHVYDGNQYIGHDPRIKIHPYYLTDKFLVGSVTYKDVNYRKVKLLYDVVWDEVVIQPLDGGFWVRLQTDKINNFALGERQFTRMLGDSIAGIRTGFYEVIYNGRVKALAKRIKTVHEDISSGRYVADYLIKDFFVIQKDGIYHQVKSKRSLLKLFPEHQKELRKYLRKNQLKFNDEMREQAIAQATKFYDERTRGL